MPPDPPREQGPEGLATPTQINATPTSKTVENPADALRVGEPGENTRYAPSLRGGGWGENCHRGWRDRNFTRTG